MSLHCRLRKLEKKIFCQKEVWAVFSINFYQDEKEQKKAQKRLLSDYVKAGNPRPTGSIFITEVPGPCDTHYPECLLNTF